MKTFPIAQVLCSFSLCSFACMDPPTPLTLTGSTFEREELSVSSQSIDMGIVSISYNPNEKKWCFTLSAKLLPNLKNCKVKHTLPIQSSFGNQTAGVFVLDAEKKTATLFQVKNGGFGTNKYPNFEINREATQIVFSEKSEGDVQRIAAEAKDGFGVLGSVVSERNINAKGLPALEFKREKVDLRSPKVKIAGCGGVEGEEPLNPRRKPYKEKFYSDLHRHR